MANEDNEIGEIIWRTAPKTYAAAKRVGITKEQEADVAGYTYLWNQNKRLLELPDSTARVEYNKLPQETRDMLTSVYGRTIYNSEPISRSRFTKVLEGFDKYTRAFTMPYRIARTNPQGIQLPERDKSTLDKVQDFLIGGNLTDMKRMRESEQWKTAYNSEQLFDVKKEQNVKATYDPGTYKVAKLLSMKKGFGEVMALAETPEELKALVDFSTLLEEDPEAAKDTQLARAIRDLEQAKISPGRDIAGALGLAKTDRVGTKKDPYDVVSGVIDATYIIAADPLTYALGPIPKAFIVAKYGLLDTAAKTGADITSSIDNMFNSRSVRRYWDEVGSRIEKYSKSKDLVERSEIASELSRIFNVKTSTLVKPAEPTKPLVVDLISEWSKAGIKDADSAKNYFLNAGTAELIGRGAAGGRVPLMPTYNLFNKFGAEVINPFFRRVFGISARPQAVREWDSAKEFSEALNNAATSGAQLTDFTGVVSKRNKFTRQFERAFMGKSISIDDASDVNSVKQIARLAVDPYHADVIAQAWREGSAGTRLRMWTGLLLTVGRQLGLEATDEGKKLLDQIKITSQHLYSEDMSALKNISELKLAKASGLGIREGLTNKELSSLASQSKGTLRELSDQKKLLIQELRDLQDQLADAVKAGNADDVKFLEKDIIRVKSILKSTGTKLTGIRKGLGYDKVNIIRQALLESGMKIDETRKAIDILRNGVDSDPAIFEDTFRLVEGIITNSPKYSKAIAAYKFNDFNEFVIAAFPTPTEVAENLGRISYNPAQIGKEQYALGWWQRGQRVSVPNFNDWAKASISNPFTRFAKSYNSTFIEKLTDMWSWFNLVPRLGLRSVIEEVAFYGLAARTSDLKNLILGKAISTELRYTLQGEAQLGLINRMIYRYVKGDTISEAERIVINNTPDGLAKAVAKRVAKKQALIKVLGYKPEVVERWVDDFVNSEYGMSIIDEINEGALSTLNIGDSATQFAVLKAQKRYGAVAEFNPAVREALKDLKATGNWANLRVGAGLQFKIAWLTQIQLRLGRNTNLRFGEIVLRGLKSQENPQQTIKRLTEYVDQLAKEGKIQDFALYEALGSRQYAERMYDFVAHPFIKRNGLVNKKLVDKVVEFKTDPQTGSKLTRYKADDLTLDDLDEFSDLDAPETILGRVYIPIAEGVDGTLNKLMEKGMSWMAKQISVLGREPIFFANYQSYRKQLISAENAMRNTHLKNGVKEPLASKLASEYAANLALFFARERTLSYVDNPAIRTNAAFGLRNIARYYRATEDFYRRIGRLVKFQPQALVKARLAADALDHSGFIYTDDNGEKYFIYPGDDIVYRAVAFFVSGFDINALKQPAPVEYTGKISMLTPSIDPDAAIPTLSGPVSALSINFIDKILLSKFAPELSQDFKKTTLGKYSVGRGFFESFLPSTLVRWMNTFDEDERNSQRASAFRKALMYYSANGMVPGQDGKEPTAAQMNDFLIMLNNTARNIVVTRALMGTFVPASPQVGLGADVPEWVKKDFDIASFKPEFNNLLQVYGKDPNAMDKAMNRWTKLFPGKLAYMLSESQSTGIGSVRSTKETVDWLKDNASLIKKYPTGAMFLAPNEGNFDLEAYAYLVDQGLAKSKIIEDFFKEGIASDQYFYWRQVKTIHEQRLDAATTDAEKRYERLKWETWSEDFRKDKPLLREYLETLGSVDEKKKNAITDIRTMILNGDMPNTPTGSAIAKMTRYYDDFTVQFDQIQGSTDAERSYKKYLRQQTVEKMLSLALANPGAMSAYRTLFEPLVGE